MEHTYADEEYVQINVSKRVEEVLSFYARHYESIYGIPFTHADVITNWAEAIDGGGRL